MSHQSRMEAAKFNMGKGCFGVPYDDLFVCGLGAGVTEAKCYLYLVSRSPSCSLCLERLQRVRQSILSGKFQLGRAPILNFFLTAMTGLPGISEEVKRLRERQDFRSASGWVPMAGRAVAEGEKKLKRALKAIEKPTPPAEKPYDERVILAEETPSGRKRGRKPKEKAVVASQPVSAPAVHVVETEAEAKEMAEARIEPVIQRRKKKPLWVGKCDGCKQKKEIVAWGLCQECLDKERNGG